jgi:multicomponent Na+:H+ antiporter subunit C
MIERLLLLTLFLVGFYAILAKKNIIRKIFGLNMINNAVVILFILEGSRAGIHAPILEKNISNVVDPLPQALMLTAIVIGVCVSALALALAFRLYKAAGTFDIDEIRRKIHDQT